MRITSKFKITQLSFIPTADTVLGISASAQFKQAAIAVFNYQFENNQLYNRFVNSLNVKPDEVKELEQIPFLPIAFFKSHKVLSNKYQVARHKTQVESQKSEVKSQKSEVIEPNKLEEIICFTSSGAVQSKHYVKDITVYERSYRKAFELFYGNVEEYCILALLPSYLERGGSSLVYMAEDLIKRSKHRDSGFYLNDYDMLINKMEALEKQHQKTILLGVTYALLDLIEKKTFQLNHTIVMETGGMKGKRKEMVREELHELLCEGFGVSDIHSEYGMTELLSQAYSKGNGLFYCPPWMRVLIRDTNDPLTILSEKKTGGINIIDLANINSCSFIATQDLGKLHNDNSFEVLGRFDNSDIRGCNLLVG